VFANQKKKAKIRNFQAYNILHTKYRLCNKRFRPGLHLAYIHRRKEESQPIPIL